MILIYPLDLIAPITDIELAQIQASAGDIEVVITRDKSLAIQLSQRAQVIFGDICPEFFIEGSKLQWVQSVGAGVNKIAVFIGDRPIKLVSARGLVGPHLAEHAMALLLSITRGIAEAVRNPGWENREDIRNNQWEFTNKVIAIVGMGSAGQALAKRARAFEFMKIIGVDISPVVSTEFLDQLVNPDSINTVMGECDVVCLTLPLTTSNIGWFDYDLLSKIKRGGVLINVSRGGLVVHSDLLKLLDEGSIRAAGLDVLDIEPIFASNSNFKRRDLVITPHIAGGSPLRAKRVIDQFCQNLINWREGDELQGLYDKSVEF